MNRSAAFPNELFEFVAEYNIIPGAGAIDERDRVFLRRYVFDQCSEGRDADAARDQKHLGAALPLRGEKAVWTLDRDPRARVEPLQPAAIVADALDGEAEKAVVERSRERERVGPPPAVARQETPPEILAGARLELTQLAAGDIERNHARGLGNDLRHAQLVAKAHPQRMTDAEGEEAEANRHVQSNPVPAGNGVIGEVGPDRQLVSEGEGNRQVGVEVQKPPGLPG